MKKVLLFVALLATGTAFAQTRPKKDKKVEVKEYLNETDVPEAVKAAFKAKFPRVKDAKWEMEGENYEAEFTMATKPYEVEYNNEGQWVRTDIEIKPEMVPGNVKMTLEKTEYAKWKIVEASEFSSPAYKKAYAITLKKKNETKTVELDAKGKMIQEGEADSL